MNRHESARPNGAEHVSYRRLPGFGGLEVLRAHYLTHSFSRHMHDEYVIGVMEQGADLFGYRGARHAAPAGTMLAFNPAEAHTGSGPPAVGWTYSAIYPSLELMASLAGEIADRTAVPPYFPHPVVDDPVVFAQLSAAFRSVEVPNNALETQGLLLTALARLVTRHADSPPPVRGGVAAPAMLRRVREFIDANLETNIRLDQLAELAGLSRFHLLRAFAMEFGLPPHAYLTHVRIRQAKNLLLSGLAISDVALASGFVDQAHFTRRFKAAVGLPPGRFLSYAHAG